MRKVSIILTHSFLLFLLFFSACNKDTKKPSQYNPPPNTNLMGGNDPAADPVTSYDRTLVNQLYSALATQPHGVDITAGVYTEMVSPYIGVRLFFYPNSFKDANGNIITSGTVHLEILEMSKPGQMIRNRATTTDNGALLISGGQVKITATMNGQPVYANKYGIAFKQSGSSTQPMALYYGNTNNADSIVNWIQAPQGLGTIGNATVPLDTNSNSEFYVFDTCVNFNWINCDYFNSYNTPLTNVSLVMPDTSFNPSNTIVYLVFPTINSVTTIGMYNSLISTYSLHSAYNVPIGFNVTIVAVSNQNGTYYYFEQSGLTVTANLSVNAVMTQQTLSYITNQLSQL